MGKWWSTSGWNWGENTHVQTNSRKKSTKTTWLVVSTPLKNMKVSWGYYFQYMEKKRCSKPPTSYMDHWTVDLLIDWLTVSEVPFQPIPRSRLCQVAESWHPPLPRHRLLLWPGIDQLSSMDSSGTDWLEYLPYIRPMTFRPIFQAF